MENKPKKKSLRVKYREFVREFKEFALDGFALSAAIGIMLGAALRDVIDSLVNDIISPPISYLTTGIDLSSKFLVLGRNDFETIARAEEAGAVIIRYGNFLNELITFFITAIILFLLVYQITKLTSKFKKKKKKEKKEEKKKTKDCPYCKSEIHIKASRCPSCTSEL